MRNRAGHSNLAIIAPSGAVGPDGGGADELVADRVEPGARLLERELHRARLPYGIGRNEDRGELAPTMIRP